MKPPITDADEIRKRVAAHGRWWHEIELPGGIVTPGDDSNRLKVPILDRMGVPADMKGMRALDIGLLGRLLLLRDGAPRRRRAGEPGSVHNITGKPSSVEGVRPHR